MAFNEAKCQVMHVGRHNPRHVYHMNGIRLEVSDKERDIGVTTSNNLKPAEECKKGSSNSINSAGPNHTGLPL